MPASKKISSTRVSAKIDRKKKTPRIAVRLSQTRMQLLNVAVIRRVVAGVRDLLQRRPHRSFKRTYRRDYVRPLRMPGYWSFTHHVQKTLWQNKKIFTWLTIIYCLATVLIAGIASEATYTQLREAVNSSSQDLFTGVLGGASKAGLLVASGLTGALNSDSTDARSSQQVLLALAGLLIWLTTVWLLRAILAGHKPRLRDGLYNAGAPILPTFLVALVIIIQLLPVAVALFGYGAALSSGLLDGGVEAMFFWSVAGLLTLLSLYWLSATFIALVVVTLPGVYPIQALRTAGDLVIGRRVRILLRLLWMALMLVIAWVCIAIPIVLFDEWLKAAWPAVSWLPTVPVMLLVMSSVSVVWTASYVYLLYRKIVEDDALPA